MTDPRFQYPDPGPAAVSVATLDTIALSIFDPAQAKGPAGWIAAAAKLLLAGVYFFARDRLIAQQAELAKQRYEVGQAGSNQHSIDQDPLSGQKRPVS